MKTRQIRQGDVLVFENQAARKGAPVARENGRVVLAHGEVTGHAHAIGSSCASLYLDDTVASAPDSMQLIGLAGGMVPDRTLEVTEPVALVHEEHADAPIARGLHAVRIQKEYRPEGVQNVAD